MGGVQPAEVGAHDQAVPLAATFELPLPRSDTSSTAAALGHDGLARGPAFLGS